MQLQRNYQSSKHDSFVNYYHADGCMLAVSTISCNENNVFATPRISRSRLETRRRWIVVTRQWNVTAVSKLEIVPINRVHLGFIERERASFARLIICRVVRSIREFRSRSSGQIFEVPTRIERWSRRRGEDGTRETVERVTNEYLFCKRGAIKVPTRHYVSAFRWKSSILDDDRTAIDNINWTFLFRGEANRRRRRRRNRKKQESKWSSMGEIVGHSRRKRCPRGCSFF